MAHGQETWDLWIPEVGTQGVAFARGRLDATDTLLVHAAPPRLDVEVRDRSGTTVARGTSLARTDQTPMARLWRQGDTISREDVWPSMSDLGVPVIVAGGEAGLLRAWWHAPDHSEWRWSLELYNHR